jgi:TrfA protein
MSVLERQEIEADIFLNQWKIVIELFIKRHNKIELENYLINSQIKQSTPEIIIINVSTRFIKTQINLHKSDLLKLWRSINPKITTIEILVGRTQKENYFSDNQKETAEIIKLPLWSETKRGTPNSALRGSLFAAIHGNQRKILYRKTICDEPNLKIIFTGMQLDQSDLDVWEMAIHTARQQNLETDIYFTAKGFLKKLGRQIGQSGIIWLKESLSRLVSCSVEITHGRYTYADNLISFVREEDSQRYKLSLNQKMVKLYQAGWTAIDLNDRQAIGKRPLALWLHGYIASHVTIYPTRIETYHRLSGSTNQCMRDFKRHLKNALEHLCELKLIKSFCFQKDLVKIETISKNLPKKL